MVSTQKNISECLASPTKPQMAVSSLCTPRVVNPLWIPDGHRMLRSWVEQTGGPWEVQTTAVLWLQMSSGTEVSLCLDIVLCACCLQVGHSEMEHAYSFPGISVEALLKRGVNLEDLSLILTSPNAATSPMAEQIGWDHFMQWECV